MLNATYKVNEYPAILNEDELIIVSWLNSHNGQERLKAFAQRHPKLLEMDLMLISYTIGRCRKKIGIDFSRLRYECLVALVNIDRTDFIEEERTPIAPRPQILENVLDFKEIQQ